MESYKFKAGDVVRVVKGKWNPARYNVNLLVVAGEYRDKYMQEHKITVNHANAYAHELKLVKAVNTRSDFEVGDIVKLVDGAQGWLVHMYNRLFFVTESMEGDFGSTVPITAVKNFPLNFVIVQKASGAPVVNQELVKLQKQIDELQAQAKKLEESMKP